MISEREAARYPFTKRVVDLVETLNLKVDDLADPSYARVLDRAAQRVAEAILNGIVSDGPVDDLTELLSFPAAIMIVNAIGDPFLSSRYAMAEATRISRLLRTEAPDRIASMAREEFAWDLRTHRQEIDGQLHAYGLYFADYLRNAAQFHEAKWKLVNRAMRDGYVSLTQAEATRLIQAEVDDLILSRASRHIDITLPDPVRERVDRVAKLFEENRSKIGGDQLPAEAVGEAFPPCIRHAYEGLVSGRRASHMERFALTSFLVNTSVDRERIVQLFVSATDFDEQMTRYQIEHIAGLRGSRTRYTPPTCATMRTHGVCHDPDDLCRRIRHPLSYYRRKIRALKGEEKPAEKQRT